MLTRIFGKRKSNPYRTKLLAFRLGLLALALLATYLAVGPEVLLGFLATIGILLGLGILVFGTMYIIFYDEKLRVRAEDWDKENDNTKN
jgi:hypothetical protein